MCGTPWFILKNNLLQTLLSLGKTPHILNPAIITREKYPPLIREKYPLFFIKLLIIIAATIQKAIKQCLKKHYHRIT